MNSESSTLTPKPGPGAPISWPFNAALTAFFIIGAIMSGFLDPTPTGESASMFGEMLQVNFAGGMVLFLGCSAVMIPLSIWFTRRFWNGFVADIWSLREISYAEAYALSLFLTMTIHIV